jgi:hypothetical protein
MRVGLTPTGDLVQASSRRCHNDMTVENHERVDLPVPPRDGLTHLLAQWATGRRGEHQSVHFRTYVLGEAAPRTVVYSFAALSALTMRVASRIAAITRAGDRVLIAADPGLAYHLASWVACSPA